MTTTDIPSGGVTPSCVAYPGVACLAGTLVEHGRQTEESESVMVGRVADKDVFQVRLNELFTAADRRLTNAAVAKGLLARGCRVSTPYLSQLRTGVRTSPSDEVVGGLADYFGVSPGYFFTIPWTGDRAVAAAQDADIVDRLDNQELKQLLQTANGLSATSLELLLNLAGKLRISDQRRKVPADSPGYARLAEAAVGPRRTTPTRQPSSRPSTPSSSGLPNNH
ncbi:helix-turn-helix domain-containing protein [Rhodococcus erythropolis]|uniref:helix-turn-helix domain-containing protein n=1 Tax=Rhodococcus erythropolis TaxID=1833 RepID=UPI0029496ED1|nr:helix-turn-helix domain-containing protein [Rhodococcus erythropolis]MDV6277808.1 helix-turn-helix domain-containing protein [Rhodococcus erythropolis]